MARHAYKIFYKGELIMKNHAQNNHYEEPKHYHSNQRPKIMDINEAFPGSLPDGVTGTVIVLPKGANINDIDIDEVMSKMVHNAEPNDNKYTEKSNVDSHAIDEIIKDGDKYIHPALLEAREKRDLVDGNTDPDLKESYKYALANNALLAEELANDMADTYRRHIATMLEYNTEQIFEGLKDTRNVLYHLIDNEDD